MRSDISEITLPLRPPVPPTPEKTETPPIPYRAAKRHYQIRKYLWALAIASSISAIIFGSTFRHERPQASLLPIEEKRRELNLANDSPSPTATNTDSGSLKVGLRSRRASLNGAGCLLELNSKRYDLERTPLFPACEKYSQARSCDRIELRYLETIYLLAYASGNHRPQKSRLWLTLSAPHLERCRERAPELTKRGLAFLQKLSH